MEIHAIGYLWLTRSKLPTQDVSNYYFNEQKQLVIVSKNKLFYKKAVSSSWFGIQHNGSQ